MPAGFRAGARRPPVLRQGRRGNPINRTGSAPISVEQLAEVQDNHSALDTAGADEALQSLQSAEQLLENLQQLRPDFVLPDDCGLDRLALKPAGHAIDAVQYFADFHDGTHWAVPPLNSSQ